MPEKTTRSSSPSAGSAAGATAKPSPWYGPLQTVTAGAAVRSRRPSTAAASGCDGAAAPASHGAAHSTFLPVRRAWPPRSPRHPGPPRRPRRRRSHRLADRRLILVVAAGCQARPTSSSRDAPATTRSSAASGSWGIPAPRAMLFHEPSGTIPSVTALATSAVAAGRTVPSPPATTTSRLRGRGALASAPGSSPSASTRRSTASPPRRSASTDGRRLRPLDCPTPGRPACRRRSG